jgi:hypothetical protein
VAPAAGDTRMAAKKLRNPTRFKRVTKNPCKGPITQSISNIINSSKDLSKQRAISNVPDSSGAEEDAIAIFGAFGISVIEQSENSTATLIDGDFLDSDKLEVLQKMQDKNPNITRDKEFKNLKNKKIPISKIFDQSVSNPINELDACQANAYETRNRQPVNVIEMADDFVNSSQLGLAERLSQ